MARLNPVELLVKRWEAVQVELQGQYSSARLNELHTYGKRVSTMRCVMLVLTMPLVPLTVIVGLETLPMRSLGLGLYHQTTAFWFRCFGTSWVMTFMMIHQLLLCLPSLPMSRLRHWVMSIVVSVALVVDVIILDKVIGFPVPFGMLMLSPVWVIMMVFSLWLTWKDIIRRDSVAQYNLRKSGQVYSAQVVIVLVYMAFNCIFSSLSSGVQTLSSACLPVMKLVFKNWISHGVHHLEDLAPVLVIFNVDTFHALFVSSTMQQSTTRNSIGIATLVDCFQICVAFYELNSVLVHAKKLRKKTRKGPTRANSVMDIGLIQYATDILSRSVRIREHPMVALPRHLHNQPAQSRPHARVRVHPDNTQLELISPHAVMIDRAMIAHAQRDISVLTGDELRQVKSVQLVLKALHMIEFYVMIEFVEALMAGIYSAFNIVDAITLHCANWHRALRSHILIHDVKTNESCVLHATQHSHTCSNPVNGHSSGRLHAVETVSLIVFTKILDHKFRHFSAFRLLAFVLDKHWHMIQSCLVMWTYFIIHSTLEHFGQYEHNRWCSLCQLITDKRSNRYRLHVHIQWLRREG